MASKEYQHMIELGEWIEKLFDPNIKPQLIEKHFNDGLKLLNISHQKIEPFKELSNMKLEKSETIYQRLQPYTIKLKEYYELENSIVNESLKLERVVSPDEEEIRKINTLQRRFFRHQKENPEIFTYKDIIDFLNDTNDVEVLLKNVYETQKPWAELFFRYSQEDIGKYSKIVQKLKNDFEDIGQSVIQKNNRFEIGMAIVSGIELIDTIWCYRIVTANILFRFLELGGQDRICFCKQCARFCVAKRKKRKEYCSNLCRTHASNARIAQMGA